LWRLEPYDVDLDVCRVVESEEIEDSDTAARETDQGKLLLRHTDLYNTDASSELLVDAMIEVRCEVRLEWISS
jgi:hypothetical protein